MIDRSKLKYSIGEVSHISGLSEKTLRYYDKKNILVPEMRDQNTGYRYYSEDQILLAMSATKLRERGFSLSDIQHTLKAESWDIISDTFDQKVAELNEEINQLKRQLELLGNSKSLIERATDLSKQEYLKNGERFSLSYFPKKNCIFTRYISRICVEEIFWDRFVDINELLHKYGQVASGPVTAVFHEHYTRQFFFEDGDLEIILPITNDDLINEHIKEFGGFYFASSVCIGFYSNLLKEYIDLVNWIENNNLEIIGSPIEEYLIEFTDGIDRDNYVTRFGFPVKQIKNETEIS